MKPSISPLSVTLFLIGGLAAFAGTYWDDAWHTDRGRDSFTIPPHLLLYGGVLIIGVAIALWAILALQCERRLRAVFCQPPLLLALIGEGVTLAAAPIDNAWHVAFGRDAVLWSPPHLLESIFKDSTMEVKGYHISRGESALGQLCEEQFVNDALPFDANTALRLPSWMSRHHYPAPLPRRPDGDLGAVVLRVHEVTDLGRLNTHTRLFCLTLQV